MRVIYADRFKLYRDTYHFLGFERHRTALCNECTVRLLKGMGAKFRNNRREFEYTFRVNRNRMLTIEQIVYSSHTSTGTQVNNLEVILPYTGYAVIASRNERAYWKGDTTYALYQDSAFELCFENGCLCEINKLEKATDEFRNLVDSVGTDYKEKKRLSAIILARHLQGFYDFHCEFAAEILHDFPGYYNFIGRLRNIFWEQKDILNVKCALCADLNLHGTKEAEYEDK